MLGSTGFMDKMWGTFDRGSVIVRSMSSVCLEVLKVVLRSGAVLDPSV